MMALVSAGFALGLADGEHITTNREAGVVARPLAGRSPPITTYLLYPGDEPSETLSRFIKRARAIDGSENGKLAQSTPSDSMENIEP